MKSLQKIQKNDSIPILTSLLSATLHLEQHGMIQEAKKAAFARHFVYRICVCTVEKNVLFASETDIDFQAICESWFK